ncbi:TPA: NUDIX hydrolase N-terminal domain-containing protein, partial [Pseudomonas aeruginosa]|nr:NUDIX hydrolase N-terminal domain-containing protein [Pseudomonas aeruginosa]
MPSVSDPRALAHLLELILSTAQAGLAFSKDRFD